MVVCTNLWNSKPPPTPDLPSTTQPRIIITDVDVGADDAWALFALLNAETDAHPAEHQLLAITCVTGNANVDQVAINVARVLQVAERSNVRTNPFVPSSVHSIIESNTLYRFPST